jgi:multidrug transporter EmrE-like cation transporter
MSSRINSLYLVLVVLGIVIAECIGQSCLKTLFNNPDKTHLYFAGVLSYSVVCYLLIQSYRYKSMGLVNVLWSGLSVLAVLAAGALFFHEKITTMDMIGVALILTGIVFIVAEA